MIQTLKVARAEVPLLSDAVTVCEPAATGGTVNVQELKLPLASVVQSVETLRPSKVMVTLPCVKPLPLIVRLVPGAPVPAIRRRAGLTL